MNQIDMTPSELAELADFIGKFGSVKAGISAAVDAYRGWAPRLMGKRLNAADVDAFDAVVGAVISTATPEAVAEAAKEASAAEADIGKEIAATDKRMADYRSSVRPFKGYEVHQKWTSDDFRG